MGRSASRRPAHSSRYSRARRKDVAATHFVGVAGVGMDAAEYPLGNAKAGAFGYDRETQPADVKDGLDKTILLLQVPAELKAPWLAGGGATVRGVSSGPDPVRPFVCIEQQGKHGTFAVMGDGKVRFIPETIDPNVFRSLCTMAGGEKIDDLDKIAPVVPGDATAGACSTTPPDKPPDANRPRRLLRLEYPTPSDDRSKKDRIEIQGACDGSEETSRMCRKSRGSSSCRFPAESDAHRQDRCFMRTGGVGSIRTSGRS